MISEQEFGEQVSFHHEEVRNAALPPGVAAAVAAAGAPAWFAVAMAPIMAPITTQLTNMQGQLNNIEGQLTNMQGRLTNVEARQANAMVFSQGDALEPIRNAHGNVPPNFPATLQDLNSLTSAQRSQLLQFYGRPANPVANREFRLKQLLGISIAR